MESKNDLLYTGLIADMIKAYVVRSVLIGVIAAILLIGILAIMYIPTSSSCAIKKDSRSGTSKVFDINASTKVQERRKKDGLHITYRIVGDEYIEYYTRVYRNRKGK